MVPVVLLPVVPVPVVPLLVVPLLVVPLLVVPLLVVPLPEVVPVLPDGRVAGVVVEPVPLGLVLVEPDVPELITLLVAL